MNTKNSLMILLVSLAILVAFLYGNYLSLSPYMFMLGLVAAIGVSLWASQEMSARDLILLILITTITALIDEWIHTSAEVFAYYDQLKPSPLTVFGWSLFILCIITVAKRINARFPLSMWDRPLFHIIPLGVSMISTILFAWQQGYADVFNPLMIFLYITHFALSLLYTRSRPFSWNLWIMITSMLFGGLMEYMGALEGMWIYSHGQLVPLFMFFTWAHRTWTILAISTMFNLEFFACSSGNQ